MNKCEVVNSIAEKAGLSKKDAEKALSAFVGTVTDALSEGNEVALVGFGTFRTAQRSERSGRNPKTGEAMTIEAKKAPVFKAGSNLKAAVN